MKYYENILETIGSTPLVKINKLNEGLKPLILAKMEVFNPGGSVKDRPAMKMIEEAEKQGQLKLIRGDNASQFAVELVE